MEKKIIDTLQITYDYTKLITIDVSKPTYYLYFNKKEYIIKEPLISLFFIVTKVRHYYFYAHGKEYRHISVGKLIKEYNIQPAWIEYLLGNETKEWTPITFPVSYREG